MFRSTTRTRRRAVGMAAAALLSSGLLTACGSGSADSGPSRSSASRQAEAPTDTPGAGAKGSPKPSQGDVGKMSIFGGEPLTSRQLRLSVDGGSELLADVSGLTMDQPTQQSPGEGFRLIPGEQTSGTVTVVRGSEQSQQFTDLIDGRTQPGTASLDQLDYAGNPTKHFTLQEPRVIRVENGGAQSVTIRFTNLAVG